MRRLIPLTILGCFGIGIPGHVVAFPLSAPPAEESGNSIVTVAYDQRVEHAQAWLNALGFDAGPADGLMGGRTRSAIKAYQRARGQTVTGELDRSTMHGLRQENQAASGREPRRTGSRDGASSAGAGVPAPQTSSQPSQLVIDTQVELRRRGYDVPVVNGDLDASTKAAIRRFEQDQRLLVTGEPSEPLLERIRSTDAALSRRDLVRSIQQALTERGYSPGPADGTMGRATVDAIRTYQSDARLAVNGEADLALLESLQAARPVQGGVPGKDVPEPDGARRQVTLLDDGFADGDYVNGVRWQVLKGAFAVRDGVLHSQISSAPVAQEILPNDVVLQVLKGLLGNASGTDAQVQPDAAAIRTSAAIPNEFRIRVRLSTLAEAGARFTIGSYQSEPNSGYQLVLEGNSGAVPTILAVSPESQVRVIRRGTAATGLDDRRMHEIDWVRDATGGMTVSVDGRMVLQTQDNGFSQAFDGLVMVNTSGSWAVDQVRIDTSIN